MTETVWLADQIEKWDEESLLRGFKVGPVDRPSTLSAFWNEAQAEKWAEDGFPTLTDESVGEFPCFCGFGFLDDEFVGVIS